MRFCHEYTVLSYERVRSLIWRNWGLHGQDLVDRDSRRQIWNVKCFNLVHLFYSPDGKTWKDVVMRKKIDMQLARFDATIQRPLRRLIHELNRYRYRGICPITMPRNVT
jgi:hypothetical protein